MMISWCWSGDCRAVGARVAGLVFAENRAAVIPWLTGVSGHICGAVPLMMRWMVERPTLYSSARSARLASSAGS
ncbi:hypothetical protein ACLMAL_28905 [Nocardia sp. CWNU-33]|uniref:hypothetical protein n=1 Tax=Nocardia sp. CWNU-33 TaxID=3392117 RepID=UPI00398E4288